MNTIGQNSCTICGVTVTGQENLRMHLEGIAASNHITTLLVLIIINQHFPVPVHN